MFRRRRGLRMPPRKVRWRRKERREVEGRKRRPRRPASPQRGAGRQRGRPGRPSRGGSRPKHRGRSVRHEKRRAEKSQEKRQGSRQGNLPENPRGKRQESRQGRWAGGRLGRSRGLRAAVDQDLSCVRTPMRRRNAVVVVDALRPLRRFLAAGRPAIRCVAARVRPRRLKPVSLARPAI